MKKLGLIFVLFSVLVGGVAAQAYDRVGYRYKVRYVDFDRGFSRTYDYREVCYTDYRWYETRTTCYDVEPSSYVYVQEQIYYDSYGRMYTRVTVYREPNGGYPIAYYNVYEDSSFGRRVVYREYYPTYGYYHSHRYYRSEYYATYWVVNLDWDQWETKVFIGTWTALLGWDLLVHSDSDLGKIIGALAIATGKIKKAQGFDEASTELQKNIDAGRNDSGANTLESLQ